ncbi:MAG: WD40/YVTN/BNR-like repeat-containing protein, partial [Limisphaerales bacterium]
MKIKTVCVLLCVFATHFFAGTLRAQGTAFTYQGQLNSGGSPASGLYNFTFTIFNSSNGVSPATATLTNSSVAVTNGLFTTTLDFGGSVFNGNPAWLEIAVTTNGDANFVTLSPRQLLTPTPYAITAGNVTGVVPSSSVSGTYGSAVTFSNSANQFAGNGANLTSLNASQLTGGTVADARLSANVALLNANQTFSGTNAFTNLYGNSFSGSFFGNGLVGWIATNATAFQAQIDHGYLLTNSQVVTVTLPASPNVADIVRIAGAGAGGWQIAQNAGQSVLGNFSSFAGSSWLLTSAINSQNWDSIASSSDGSKLIAAVSGGGIYFSANSGVTWTETNMTSASWSSVACSSDGSKLFAARLGSGIYTNSATGWGLSSPAGSLNYYSVACSSDGTKLVTVVYGGGIYTSANSGATWTTASATTRNWFSVASSADGTKLAAVVNGGGIYTSASWSQATSAGNKNWVSIASSADGTKLAAVVDGGGIYTSTNSGATWTQQTSA